MILSLEMLLFLLFSARYGTNCSFKTCTPVRVASDWPGAARHMRRTKGKAMFRLAKFYYMIDKDLLKS
jgi:hypothetical protein